MARYFFDTFDGEQEYRDSDGMECDSRETVRREATSSLPDLARELLPDGSERCMKVRVRDEGGRFVFEASLTYCDRWLDEPPSRRV